MPLRDVERESAVAELPREVEDFLRDAEARVEDYVRYRDWGERGFVPCGHRAVVEVLHWIERCSVAPGNLFCEWGSGLGVIAAAAALLGYDACGIEIDRDLFDESLLLVQEYEIPVQLINGSFVPPGAEQLIDAAFAQQDGELRLETQADSAYDELGLELCDLDVVFVYPWPNDEPLTAAIFERYASPGALLVTYSELDDIRIRRKIR